MNSLLNYGSDDDYDDSSEEKSTDWRGTAVKSVKDIKEKTSTTPRQTDTNYEEVQMDLSEESNDSKPEPRRSSSQKSRERESKDRDRREDYRGRHDRDRERRSSRDKDARYRERRDRDRERDRRPRRSSSREKRRSRSPPRRDRSRSRSRDRTRKYTKRYERGDSKSRQGGDRYDPQKSQEEDKRNTGNTENGKFFMPGISGRFREQIERRKQLWQKKEAEPADPKNNVNNGQSKKVWETTTFAQDADGKMANKFKRLMGIKNASAASGQGVDVLKKQEEMFSSMEQQYEVARTATHTMRGVGLGFGSFQR